MKHQPRFVSIRDAATILGVSQTTIWRMTKRGDLPQPERIGPRLRRFRIADIELIGQQRKRLAP